MFSDILEEQIKMPVPGQPETGDGHSDGNDSDEDDLDSDHSLSLFHRAMQNAAQRARAKLNGHSSMCRVYFTKMSTELVNLMFEISWPFFYRCITVVLDEQDGAGRNKGGAGSRHNKHSKYSKYNKYKRPRRDDVQHLELVACVLDLLRYSISACLCLGMETERRAFAALLAKFHFLHSNSGEWDSVGDVMVFGHEEHEMDEMDEEDEVDEATMGEGGQGNSGKGGKGGKGGNSGDRFGERFGAPARARSHTSDDSQGGRGTTSGSNGINGINGTNGTNGTVRSKEEQLAQTRELLSGKHLEQTWFKHVMQTSAHDSGAVMDVISEVHQLASRLRDRVMYQHRSKSLRRLCQTRFVKTHAEQILQFNRRTDRTLLKEGILVRHTQTGKRKKYRFFLFSDLCLYASGGGRSKLKVHNYLPLASLTIREAPQEDDVDPLVSAHLSWSSVHTYLTALKQR